MSETPEEYAPRLAVLIDRILSLWNANPHSDQYGCFDRNFWHFRTLVDFPSATYQQPVLGLARLATAEGPWRNLPLLNQAVRSGVLYWCSIQNRDGSLNEYYQNDRSFCPTAFTTFAIADAIMQAPHLFSDSESDRIVGHLVKSARWLDRHTFDIVQNQMIASLNSIERVARLSGDRLLAENADRRLERVLASQNEEGWFPEYSGADIGYSFKQLDLLACYHDLTGRAEVLSAAGRLAAFIAHFLHPDGSAGGEYGSRATQHVFPFGVEYFARRQNFTSLEFCRAWIHNHLKQGRLIGPAIVDDKYSAYFYLNSYALAACLDPVPAGSDLHGGLPEQAFPEVVNFPVAGVTRIERGQLRAWIGTRRNGTARAYWGDRLIHHSCGYLIREGGLRLSTDTYNDESQVDIRHAGEHIELTVSGRAGRYTDDLPLVRWIVPFKLFCRTVLRWSLPAYWFHSFLKHWKIARPFRSSVTLVRRFSFGSEQLRVEDTLRFASMSTKRDIVHNQFVTTVHSPSSRFFQSGDLNTVAADVDHTERGIEYSFRSQISFEK